MSEAQEGLYGLGVESDAAVATVTLERPPVNAVSSAMYKAIRRFFSDPDAFVPQVRAVVLAGAGRHFSAGNELDEFETMTPDNGPERMYNVREAFFSIQMCPVPVIGAVAGVALGTGLALAASCDFVVASNDAVFGLPELSVGVMGGARHLARLVPEPIVRWMFLTGERLSAERMAGWGGVTSVVPKDQVIAEARGMARKVAAYSPTAVRLGKRVLNRIEGCDIRRGYEVEQEATVRMSGHPDSKAALRASRLREPITFGPPDAM